MCRTLLCLAIFLGLIRVAPAFDTAEVPYADGFDLPVGQNGKSYYKARGVRPNGHLGEDWNGVGGGDTDLGDPIYSAANGIVTFAEDFRLGWGNVVIIRSAYQENGEVKFVDSLYGHLLDFQVRKGDLVKRGQLIARMGSNRGMYPAHLHFEMRKNIKVGMFRSSFPRDWSVYWSPTEFVAAHRTCPGGGSIASVPVNTYPNSPPPIIASTKVATPEQSVARAGVGISNGQMVRNRPAAPSPLRRVYVASSVVPPGRGTRMVASSKGTLKAVATGPARARESAPAENRKAPTRHSLFRVERFEDMKVLGYGDETGR
jgi:hypothetical protein